MKPAKPDLARPGIIGPRLVLAAVVALALAPVAAIAYGSMAGAGPGAGLLSPFAAAGQALTVPRNARALAFSLEQALMSALAALALGLPGAWLVAHYDFPGRRLLKALSAVPFSVPPLLVVLSFVLYFGRSGWINRLSMMAFGLSEPPFTFLYGFWGIVLVHGFYNFPIVLQTVGEVWARIPRDREESARLLGAGRLRAFATGTLPSLAPAIAQATGLAFLFCFFSFAVVLVFGGLTGSTLEVEVYRRARIEADPSGAAAIALLESAVAMAVVALIGLAEGKNSAARRGGTPVKRERPAGWSAIALLAYASLIAVFFFGPLAALAVEAFTVSGPPGEAARAGFGNFARLFARAGFLSSLADTAVTALPAAFLAAFAGSLAAVGMGRKDFRGRGLAGLPLAISGIVAALGWSLIFPDGGNALVVPVLAFTALPFVIKSVSGALATLEPGPGLAARTLGASALRATLTIKFPAVAPAILAAGAFSFAISAGDLNAPLVLGRGSFQPIPILMYRLTSSYRFSEACAAGLVLALMTGLVFFAKDGGSDARA